MAIKMVFAVRDLAADTFGSPLAFVNRAVAVRAFVDEVNNPRDGSSIYHHPEDFELWCLAEYEDTTGEFKECVERVARGQEVKAHVP